MPSSPVLTGTVTQRLDRGGFGVTLLEPLFFLVDHNYPPGGDSIPVPLLMTVLDAPFTLRIDGSGPRGFIAELKTEHGRVASANTFDPAGLNTKAKAVIDRWEDTGDALVATTADTAWEDRGSTVQLLKLYVRKLLILRAGGIVWRQSGPVTTRDKFDTLARRMKAYGPSTPFDTVQSSDIDAFITAMEDLETTDQKLEELGFRVPHYTVGTGPEPGFVNGGALGLLRMAGAVEDKHKGGGAFLGRGEQIHEPTGKAIEPMETGGEQLFELLLFACNSPEALGAFRKVRSRP